MELSFVYGNKENQKCHFVRQKVFIDEQGFNQDTEFDKTDEISYHLLVEENGEPIATGRLFCENGVFHCGRICVLKEHRDRHIGLLIMEKLEEKARELGAKKLTLSAQKRVSSFYKKAGYTEYGEEYLDEFCPHIAMEKKL